MRRGLLGMMLLIGCTKAEGPAMPSQARLPAAGIRVGSVEANQGVPVAIGRDGDGIDGPQRTAALIHGRRTLLRAYWQVDEDWRARRIAAQLTLRTHQGEERSLTSVRLVAAPADPGDLRRAWTWTLAPEEATPGLQYRVELFEAEPDPDGSIELDPDADPPSTPQDGFVQVGLEPSRQVFEVVVVPIERDDADCQAQPELAPGRIDYLHDRLLALLPVQEVRLSVREPVVWTEPLDAFDPLIDMLGQLKQDDGARSQVYYYGLLGACGKVGGYSGQAHSIPVVPVPTQPWTRVAVGISEQDDQATAHTMAHELGHVLGRRHVACSGNEKKPDESYPYRDGSIGGWGWGVVDEQLRSPAEAADYMGYCDQDWVSDYGWNITFWFIRLLSQFPQPGAPAAHPVLVGSIDPDGEQRWFLADGELADDAPQRVRWLLADGDELTTPALVTARAHGESLNVVAAWPHTSSPLAGAWLDAGDGTARALEVSGLAAPSG